MSAFYDFILIPQILCAVMNFQEFSENAVPKPKMVLKSRISISVDSSCSGKRENYHSISGTNVMFC